MSFRTKLLAFFTLTIVAAVTLVAWGVSVYTRRAFEEFDRQRTDALVAQFRREYAQRGEEIARRVQGIADAEATLRMAMDLNRPQADASQYYNDARGIAQTQQLDFLDIVADDGTLISSAEWPARFGYKNDWVGAEQDWNSQGAFLRRVDMPDTVELGLLAVRTVRVGEKRLYLIGGQRLNQNFLATLVLPESMRALLYRNLEPGFVPSALTDLARPGGQPELFAPLITEVQRTRRELQRRIDWTSDHDGKLRNFQCHSADGPRRRFAGRPAGGKFAPGSGPDAQFHSLPGAAGGRRRDPAGADSGLVDFGARHAPDRSNLPQARAKSPRDTGKRASRCTRAMKSASSPTRSTK